MRITNIRLGHATNSSSSHSLVIMPKGRHFGTHSEAPQFGWDNFTLADTDSKMLYLAMQLRANFEPEVADQVIRDLTGLTDVPVSDDYDSPNWGYIDHQSVWSMPRKHGSKEADPDFAAFIAEQIRRDDVLILGGNDNSDGHPLREEAERDLTDLVDSGWQGMAAREDPTHWTIFNNRTGAKVRLSKDDDTPLRASAPELVDIKITDYCPFDCAFCYQGSTRVGSHASLENITLIADRLAEAQVFEVAMGGGEPTLHPDFPEILRIFHSRGISPNFTTRNHGWIKPDHPIAEAARETQAAWAFSTEDPLRVREIKQLAKAANLTKFNYHYVMGLFPLDGLKLYLSAVSAGYSGNRVTLLGYKTTGRGSDVAPCPYEGWYAAIQQYIKDDWEGIPYVSIDTTLARQSMDELKAVDERLYHTSEGAFSAYIDAVAMTLAPSSYEPERGSVPFDDDWLAGFQAWDIEPAANPVMH